MKNKLVIIINEENKIKQLEKIINELRKENKLLKENYDNIKNSKDFLLEKCNFLENKIKYFKSFKVIFN